MKIYIAGASAEIERVERAIRLARLAGFQVTVDWPAEAREVGAANPVGATDEQRRHWTERLVSGVDAAKIVWLLYPTRPSAGCWVEFGRAQAKGIYTIVSGRGDSIFRASATEQADDDDDGLAMLCAYRERSHD